MGERSFLAELRLWVRDVGFPIAVAAYVLVRLDTAIQRVIQLEATETAQLSEVVRLLEREGGRDGKGSSVVLGDGVGVWVCGAGGVRGGVFVPGCESVFGSADSMPDRDADGGSACAKGAAVAGGVVQS